MQENDIVRLEKNGKVLLLKAERCEPQGSGFVCMNETEVEVSLNFKKAKAILIGSGEAVWDKLPK